MKALHLTDVYTVPANKSNFTTVRTPTTAPLPLDTLIITGTNNCDINESSTCKDNGYPHNEIYEIKEIFLVGSINLRCKPISNKVNQQNMKSVEKIDLPCETHNE